MENAYGNDKNYMNTRLIFIDRLRLIAIVSVVIMHSSGAVQRYYSNGVDSVFFDS